MSAFAFLSFTCQLGQEGDGGFLIQHAPGTLSFHELMDQCREGVCA